MEFMSEEFSQKVDYWLRTIAYQNKYKKPYKGNPSAGYAFARLTSLNVNNG
jgi:hypothetical protein